MGKQKKPYNRLLPDWFDGKTINEARFCEAFLQTHRIVFANGAFFTPDGRVTDDLPLRAEIYDALKSWAISNIAKKIANILEVLKMEAQAADLPPQPDRIHLSNGTLLLDGRFTSGRPEIVRNRLPVRYNPDAPDDEERKRICTVMQEAITALATGLPEHTVVPYVNIPKKDYPRNTQA